MKHLNVEFKARCGDLERVRGILQQRSARHVGRDHQVDTYFRAERGRLKLREGSIEKALIHYDREDRSGPKTSDVTLVDLGTRAGGAPGGEYDWPPEASVDPKNKAPLSVDTEGLKQALRRAMGELVVVDKQRDIYFIDNVKVHLDTVEGLGTFVEAEAIADAEHTDKATLRYQCEELLDAFGIAENDLIDVSYSDMILQRKGGA